MNSLPAHFLGVRLHLFASLLIVFGCFAAQVSWARTLKPADGLETRVSLSGDLAIFHDPSGALTIDDIVSEGANIQFEPIPSMLTEGYRKGAVWVRFSLAAPAAPTQWLLEIERPLIEHVALYVPDGEGRFTLSRPGDRGARQVDDARAYPALFPISVSSTENDYYIRLQSTTSITTALRVWQEEGYENYRRSGDWIMALMVGAIGAMLLANLLYALWLRDPRYLLYAAVLLESGLMTLFHMGYAAEALHFLSQQHIYRLWGVVVCLYSIVMVSFLAWIFDFRRHSIRVYRLFQGIILINGIAMLFAIAGRYGDVALLVSRLQQLSYLLIAGYVSYLLVVKRRYQYWLPAVSFAAVIAVSFVMQMQYTGTNPLHVDSSLSRILAVGTLIHLVLLSAAVAQRAQLAERSLSEEKDRVIAVSQAAERDLTIKVQERTAQLAEKNASLTAEIDRRGLLEEKLRQSLDSVNDALAQQRDFVAVVSHEFRSPLAVIAATADNLLSSPSEGFDSISRRVGKIGRTVRRMSLLIENVLADDRLHAGQPSFTKTEVFHLNEILHATKVGLDEDAARRVNFIQDDEVTVKGDRILLEIVVQNLIQNALKYSAVTAPVTVQLSSDRDVAFVSVTDQGIGVAPSDREFIFMKYYRASGQSANGSGLGLYISREIARQSGGDLLLSASDTTGSTFCLSLPIEGARSNWMLEPSEIPYSNTSAPEGI